MSNILRQIRRSNPHIDYELMQKAERLFGEMNGWVPSQSLHGIDIRSDDDVVYCNQHTFSSEVFDHRVIYRENKRPYRAVAVIGQPYHLPRFPLHLRGRIGMKKEAELKWIIAPRERESFWYPGECYFIVVTRPDIEVRFLSEQRLPPIEVGR